MDWKEVSKMRDLEEISKALTKLNVNEQDERGRTPLMLFLTNRMPIQAIELLIEQGAALDLEDKLGDTALKKAVKFKQTDAIHKLIEAGAELNSTRGILATAWNAARSDTKMADLLLETEGAIRLTLTAQEQEIVDEILYEESLKKVCEKIGRLHSSVLLHAIVNRYNWDDGPEPMMSAFENSAISEITLLDMYELLEGDYWLEKDDSELKETVAGLRWQELALRINARLS
ncbi:DUF4274 domain-containing protein [Paenibacillus arenosi]|uniref:DUF4274 domain-containing protein n=1 Tax=Paenibacillus arenosi TaxID=2774142 RepID=A0ABR9AZI0_9BACL|nr:DUF4274 domain-containing protein [Paenibacillus arenosi]